MRRELAAMHTQVCMTEELPPIPDLLSEEAHDFLALCFIRAPACRPADQTFVFLLGADAWLRNACWLARAAAKAAWCWHDLLCGGSEPTF